MIGRSTDLALSLLAQVALDKVFECDGGFGYRVMVTGRQLGG
jgi:hypothetical protein